MSLEQGIVGIRLSLLILCCILSFIVVSHTIYKFCISHQSRLGSKSKFTVKFTVKSKFTVLTAMILLFTHSLTHTSFQLLQDTLYHFTTFGCKAYVIILSIAYYMGKSSLLCFYIVRASDAFEESSIAYSTYDVIKYVVIVNFFSIISAIGWPIFQLPFTESVMSDNGDHYYCVISAAVEDSYEYHTALTYFLIYATMIEIILSIWTVWLFIGKLIKVSHGAYLLKKKSLDNNANMDGIELMDDRTSNLDELDYNNKQHVEIWHNETKRWNSMLILITKLFVLLIISVITSQVALAFYFTVFSRVYAIDSCINVYCMYLSFCFTDTIWKKWFCGNQCISCSFPLIKMWAFTSSKASCCFKTMENMDDNEESNNYRHCQCICSVYDAEQRNMHKMIKNEYKLIIQKKLSTI